MGKGEVGVFEPTSIEIDRFSILENLFPNGRSVTDTKRSKIKCAIVPLRGPPRQARKPTVNPQSSSVTGKRDSSRQSETTDGPGNGIPG